MAANKFYKDTFKCKFLFSLMTTVMGTKNCTSYLPTTGVAFQREMIQGNEQPPIQGNKNLMNTIEIVWIVAGISRTSQKVVLY